MVNAAGGPKERTTKSLPVLILGCLGVVATAAGVADFKTRKSGQPGATSLASTTATKFFEELSDYTCSRAGAIVDRENWRALLAPLHCANEHNAELSRESALARNLESVMLSSLTSLVRDLQKNPQALKRLESLIASGKYRSLKDLDLNAKTILKEGHRDIGRIRSDLESALWEINFEDARIVKK